jgi:hypothetical protein
LHRAHLSLRDNPLTLTHIEASRFRAAALATVQPLFLPLGPLSLMFYGATSLTVPLRSTSAIKGGAVLSQSRLIAGSALTKICIRLGGHV